MSLLVRELDNSQASTRDRLATPAYAASRS
jgi:hypothetical protein